eukprot:c14918_g1_i1.p1 GENE.c14918_g1_i1~~c14918_g1_i1.p1  ORF type:complete len:825 (+),score=205.64 c14918_g1_i1:242-2476(+)
MMEQAQAVRHLDGVLQVVRESVHGVQDSYDALQSAIQRPLKIFEDGVPDLASTNESATYLRFAARFLSLIQKLKQDMPLAGSSGAKRMSTDTAKSAAQCIQEIQTLIESQGLDGIEVVDRERSFVSSATATLRSDARAAVIDGMTASNQAQINLALQVFFHLRCLPSEVTQVMSTMQQETLSILSTAIVEQTPAAPGVSQAKQTKVALWQGLERMYDQLRQQCHSVYLFALVLSRAEDKSSRTSFIELVNQAGGSQLDVQYWYSLTSMFRSEMHRCCEEFSSVKQAITEDYPRLHRLHGQFMTHVTSPDRLAAAFTPEQRLGLATVFDRFEGEFLEYSAKQLATGVRDLCSALSLLTPSSSMAQANANAKHGSTDCSNQLGVFLTVAQRDLKRAADCHSAPLAEKITSGVLRSLATLHHQCKSLIATGPDAVQVKGQPTNSQILNAQLFKCAYQIRTKLSQSPSTSPASEKIQSDVQSMLESGLQPLDELSSQIISPLFQSILVHVDNCFIPMHTKPRVWWQAQSNTTSPWLTDSQQLLSHIRTNILSLYLEQSIRAQKQRLVQRLVRAFLDHISLIPAYVPAADGSPASLARLANELSQFQYQVSLLFPLQECGNARDMLGAFRSLCEAPGQDLVLVLREWAGVETSDLALKASVHLLPTPVILHHAFLRGPKDLVLPHVLFEWRVVEYLEKVRTGDKTVLVNVFVAALEQYKQAVGLASSEGFSDPICNALDVLTRKLQRNE